MKAQSQPSPSALRTSRAKCLGVRQSKRFRPKARSVMGRSPVEADGALYRTDPPTPKGGCARARAGLRLGEPPAAGSRRARARVAERSSRGGRPGKVEMDRSRLARERDARGQVNLLEDSPRVEHAIRPIHHRDLAPHPCHAISFAPYLPALVCNGGPAPGPGLQSTATGRAASVGPRCRSGGRIRKRVARRCGSRRYR
jgi:hypothetical protein